MVVIIFQFHDNDNLCNVAFDSNDSAQDLQTNLAKISFKTTFMHVRYHFT